MKLLSVRNFEASIVQNCSEQKCSLFENFFFAFKKKLTAVLIYKFPNRFKQKEINGFLQAIQGNFFLFKIF